MLRNKLFSHVRILGPLELLPVARSAFWTTLEAAGLVTGSERLLDAAALVRYLERAEFASAEEGKPVG